MTKNDVNPSINNHPMEKRNKFIDHPLYRNDFFFPDDFHKSLRELLAKIILENLPAWRTQAINNQGKTWQSECCSLQFFCFFTLMREKIPRQLITMNIQYLVGWFPCSRIKFSVSFKGHIFWDGHLRFRPRGLDCYAHIFIPRHTKSGRVLCYTLWTLSVRPSVRLSVSALFPCSNFSTFWPIFSKFCIDIGIGEEWYEIASGPISFWNSRVIALVSVL